MNADLEADGVSRVFDALATELEARGHEVAIVLTRATGESLTGTVSVSTTADRYERVSVPDHDPRSQVRIEQ